MCDVEENGGKTFFIYPLCHLGRGSLKQISEKRPSVVRRLDYDSLTPETW